MSDKVIVTNLTALKKKYAAGGVTAIRKAIAALVTADKKRGFNSVLIGVDDAAAMTKLKATAVKDQRDAKQNKVAIDGIYKALTPDYIMILGAIDVIPHQDLKNSMFSENPEADNEEFAYGDLPYACDAPYSQDVNKFTGPTRVVSRLPDLTGYQGKPDYLLGLLKTATDWQSLPREKYEDYLGISVEKWRESTALSLQKTFNNNKDLQTCPTKDFNWKALFFNRRIHFINCHGGDTLPDFYGQSETDDEDMPVSHRAALVGKAGNVTEGTVVAAECCFGGQLYDPTAEADGQMGMCNAYLGRKAYAFFGSTTTAYGPFMGNDQADLICQYFLQRVLAGASIGRATLEARQRFVEVRTPLSNMNQKTLAQFNLYGDPSIVPVDIPTSKLAVGRKAINLMASFTSKNLTLAGSQAVRAAAAFERSARRETLRAKGVMLSELQPGFKRRAQGPSKSVQATMDKLMRKLNFKPVETISFDVAASKPTVMSSLTSFAQGVAKSMAAKTPQTTAFHVSFGVRSPGKNKNVKGAAKDAKDFVGEQKEMTGSNKVKNFVVLEAQEVDGKIVNVVEAHSK